MKKILINNSSSLIPLLFQPIKAGMEFREAEIS